jgi:hypothetical protein
MVQPVFSRKATPFHQYFPALLPKEIKVIVSTAIESLQ